MSNKEVYLHNMSIEEKFNAVREWQNTKCPRFDLGFIDAIETQYYQKKELTEKQEKALDKIIVSWGVLDE